MTAVTEHRHPHSHPVEQANAFAGQGAVLLDIGGDIGALVVMMPQTMEGTEIEIRPIGDAAGSAPTHVGVVARPGQHGRVPSIVFPELPEGDYELYERPAGPVTFTATIRGGEVASAVWPQAT